MGSLDKIDDNNFVIKYKTEEIKNIFVNEAIDHLDYSWNLKTCGYYNHKIRYFLKCTGSNNDLWNIDASVTWNFFNKDGKKEISRSINACFNLSNPECVIDVRTNMKILDFEDKHPNVEVHVKINSITGVQAEPRDINFEKNDATCDVTLIVEEKKLYVNKAVLATFSPVFRAMFFSGFKESTDKEVIINDVKFRDFEQFLQVIHTAYPYIDEDNIQSLLVLADRYDVKVVMEKSENYLLSTDDVTDAEKLRLAETYTFPDVHRKTMESIDTKERVNDICKHTSKFGPMTLQAIIRKMLDLQINQ